MNDRQIECFLAVSRYLSFSRAAQALFLTQPTVTHQIATLEDELGFALFLRNHRSIAFTPAGQQFYENMLPIVEQTRRAIAESENIARSEDTYLSLGHYSPEGDRLFYRAMYAFSEHCRSSHVDIRLPQPNKLVDHLLARRLDGIFVPSQLIGNQIDLTTLPLFSNHEYCVMSRHHALAGKPSLTLDDLEDTLILLGNEEQNRIRPWHETQLFTQRSRFTVRNGRTMREMITNLRSQQCVMISLYPMLFVSDDLVRIPFSDGPQVDTLFAFRTDNPKTSLHALSAYLPDYYAQNR